MKTHRDITDRDDRGLVAASDRDKNSGIGDKLANKTQDLTEGTGKMMDMKRDMIAFSTLNT